jgi:hypothetical protein
MLNTTSPAIPALEAITFDLLSSVSGGCHKHCCPCPQPAAPVQQMQVLQLPAMPAAAPAAPPPAPGPSGDVVSTNVSINGQPTASA